MALVEVSEVATLSNLVNIKPSSEPIKSSVVPSQLDELSSKVQGGKTQFALEEHPVDTLRPIKVGIVGAGLGGITAGVLLPAKLPGIDLRIYDKNADVVCQ